MRIIRTGPLFSIESLFPSASETIERDSGAGCRNMSGDSMHNWGNQSFVLALTRIAEGNRRDRGAPQWAPQPGFPGKMGPL